MNKLALIDFTHSHDKIEKSRPLTLSQRQGDNDITHRSNPSVNAKLLGVIFETRANWTAQREKVREKALKWTTAFKRFTKTAS
jgi:hypothetical protein